MYKLLRIGNTRLTVIIICCLSTLFVVNVAQADASTTDHQWYAGLQFGLSCLDGEAYDGDNGKNWSDVTDTGFDGTALLGYAFSPNWSVELQLAYLKNNLNNSTEFPNDDPVESIITTFNVKYTLRTTGKLTPYAALGFGTYVPEGVLSDVLSDTHAAINANLGLLYPINPRTDITLDYHYIAVSKEWYDGWDMDVSIYVPTIQNLVNIGVLYHF